MLTLMQTFCSWHDHSLLETKFRLVEDLVGLTTSNSKDDSTAVGCTASYWITVSITGLFCPWRLVAGIVSGLLTDHTELSNPE